MREGMDNLFSIAGIWRLENVYSEDMRKIYVASKKSLERYLNRILLGWSGHVE